MIGSARLFLSTIAVLATAAATSAAEFPKFRTIEIDPHAGNICYAVTLADVDGDQKQDIVVVTENRVLWYQAPDWKKRVIIEDQTARDNVCIDAHDIDGDGKVDFALGAGWTKTGTIQWLSRGPSLDEKWRVHMIGEEPWTHRMRFADVLGTGTPQLVVSPLNRTTGDGVRLTAFEIPKNPKMDRWPRTVLDDTMNRMHNHWHAHLGLEPVIDTLTASQEGVHLLFRRNDGWQRLQIGRGAVGDKPEERGAGEVKLGRLDQRNHAFVATVEPMHGTSLVVYTMPVNQRFVGLWNRTVIDDTYTRGHAVWCADFDGDWSDEIVCGHSDPGTGEIKTCGLYIYRADDASGTKWTKHVLDAGGVAVEDAVAGDLTGDGRPDVVAVGRHTHNVRLYVNEGK